MDHQIAKTKRQLRRRRHVRRRLFGTPERPRLSVFRSSKHIYAQIIDDLNCVTLAAAGTAGQKDGNGGNMKAAAEIGKKIAEEAKAKGVAKVAFDRGHYKYHGRVKALAEAARGGGLKF